MKRRLLTQLFLVLTFLVSQFGYASDYPRSSRSVQLTTADPNSCEQKDQCFVFNYKGYQISTDGKNVTLTFSIKTNCSNDLSYAAFELPSGGVATATSTSNFKYQTEITSNPFRSIKFEGVGISGYKNGAEDVFRYIMSKTDFDKLTTIRVQAKAATTIGTVTFMKNCSDIPQCVVNADKVTDVKFYLLPSTTPITPEVRPSGYLRFNEIQQGNTVKVCFNVPAGSGYATYSLVSYTAPYPYFDVNVANLQKVFDFQTITVALTGTTQNQCLQVTVPNCNFQVDLVKGCVIENLAPGNLYSTFGRLIGFKNGGTTTCVPVPPTEPEPTGNEGCTPGYWKQKQHFGNWSPLVPTGTSATKFFDIFPVCEMGGVDCSYQGLSPNLTLLEALQLEGGGFNALARHAAAAYLNAVNQSVEYSFTSMDIKAGVVDAFKTGKWEAMKDQLEKANEKGCPLGRSELTTNNAAALQVAGLPMNQSAMPLSAYPNPFNNKAVVQFALKNAEEYSVSLYNMNGKQVKLLKTGISNAGELVQLNVDGIGLPEGLYLVRLVTKSETQTVKLVLKK